MVRTRSMLTLTVTALARAWAGITRRYPQAGFLFILAVALLVPYIWAALALTED